MKKGRLIGLLIIVLFGMVRFNFEQKLGEEHRAAFFHGAKLNLSLRQQLGQTGFLAVLGGFRAVVADFIWIGGHVAWERTQWSRMIHDFNVVVTLQPRDISFWDTFGWHVGWNASLNAINDKVHEPDEAIRKDNQHQFFKTAEDVYLRGIENNPDNYLLCEGLARLYKEKLQDHYKSFVYYDKAAQFPNSPIYEKRMAAYQLAEVPGMEREAYDRLLKYYKMGERERLPELLIKLKELEDKLSIPPADRVDNPDKKQ